MSVYTSITADELRSFLAGYSAGELVRFAGIESGIENTNYFVTTTVGEYVLTIFEQHAKDELPFFLDLTAFLAEHDIPCAHPLPNIHQEYLGSLKDKPAAIVDRLWGSQVGLPTPVQCSAIGAVLARMHLATASFDQTRLNPRGYAWRRETAEALRDRLSSSDVKLLDAEITNEAKYVNAELPTGIVHADLFRDNALFDGDRLCGVIDFYYACTDRLILDVAIAVNDWCSHGDGTLDLERTRRLLASYTAVRCVSDAERETWPAMLRVGALRFWLSRLHDMHFPRPGEMTHIKDPETFRRILAHRADATPESMALWPDS